MSLAITNENVYLCSVISHCCFAEKKHMQKSKTFLTVTFLYKLFKLFNVPTQLKNVDGALNHNSIKPNMLCQNGLYL